jgi:hypothetical protein
MICCRPLQIVRPANELESRFAEGVGSRFRATTVRGGESSSENDSRPLPHGVPPNQIWSRFQHDAERFARGHQIERAGRCRPAAGCAWPTARRARPGSHQLDRLADMLAGRIAAADHADLAVVDLAAVQLQHAVSDRQRGEQADGAALADQIQRHLLRLGRRSGDDHHVGAQPAGRLLDALDQVLAGRVDQQITSELSCLSQRVGATSASTIVPAPIARATQAFIKPIGPAPRTATTSPSCTWHWRRH